MIRLFFKTAIRNLKSDCNNNILNIIGLTAGIVAFLYIMTHVFNEYNFDKFHANADRIYRCCTDLKYNGLDTKMADSNDPLAAAIMDELPDVESSIRVYFKYDYVVGNDRDFFKEDRVMFADSNLFDFFDFELISGNKKTALANPNQLVLTKEAALKYFGKNDVLGESLTMGSEKTIYKVTGILSKVPRNSHLQFDILASYSTLPESRISHWGNWNRTYTYITLKPNTDIERFEKIYAEFPMKYYGQMFKDALDISMEEFKGRGNHLIPYLQPLKDIYLETDIANDVPNKGSSRLLIILQLIGIFILAIACVNFTNISTAQASNRAREIGMKKINGGTRAGLMMQILSESFLQCLIAMTLAIVLFLLILPAINSFLGLDILPSDILQKSSFISLLALPFILALLAGGYPAFFITRLKPANIVKRKSISGNEGKWLRGSLVSFQFVIFLFLIISTFTFKKQSDFVRNHETGFSKDNIIVINNTDQLGDQKEAFKNELLRNTQIISASYNEFFQGGGNPFGYVDSKDNFMMEKIQADKEFLSTFNIELKDGRFFENNLQGESNNVVINEAAAKVLGWENCQDKYIKDYDEGEDFKVIGIVKDFQRFSLKIATSPLVILPSDNTGQLSIKIAGNNIPETMITIESTWNAFDDGTPFDYQFLDTIINSFYSEEEQMTKILSVSTIFAIVIACLGLYGMISFTANKRKREIGVRKVNGARDDQILGMLNKDFVKWVVGAWIITCPLAWYFMNKWLESFATRTSLSWWLFLIAGFGALTVTVLVVSFQSIKTSRQNPVESLRYE